jgi:FkbM family methyltransferase
MDLYHHAAPPFTRWIVESGFLAEPFVVIDGGVQGGEHPRWDFLGDQVRVHGFDAIAEAIDRLNETGKKPYRTYQTLALGNEDGEREFNVPANTYAATFYSFRPMAGGRNGDGAPGVRMVPIRRLDTLFAAGQIPPADHIKLDCEGFEPEILRGARDYMAASNILCVAAETDFLAWPAHRCNAFGEINELMARQRLRLFDLNFYRRPRSTYVAARQKHPWTPPDPKHGVPPVDVGQPRTFEVLFCRDFVAETTSPRHVPIPSDATPAPSTDKVIKAMINFELHGLMDCAVELAEHFRERLAERFDVDHAIILLARQPPHTRNIPEVVECLRMVAALRARVSEHEARISELESAMEQTSERSAELSQR